MCFYFLSIMGGVNMFSFTNLCFVGIKKHKIYENFLCYHLQRVIYDLNMRCNFFKKDFPFSCILDKKKFHRDETFVEDHSVELHLIANYSKNG